MGKGDKKSRKGKIWRGSHGNTRPKFSHSFEVPAEQPVKAAKATKEKTTK